MDDLDGYNDNVYFFGECSKLNLSEDQRRGVFEMLLARSNNGKPLHGSKKDVAIHFGIHPRTVARIWKRGHDSLADGAVCADVSSQMKGNYNFSG
jgi:DNA invertase Pin-like site-specific DNA recombinase